MMTRPRSCPVINVKVSASSRRRSRSRPPALARRARLAVRAAPIAPHHLSARTQAVTHAASPIRPSPTPPPPCGGHCPGTRATLASRRTTAMQLVTAAVLGPMMHLPFRHLRGCARTPAATPRRPHWRHLVPRLATGAARRDSTAHRQSPSTTPSVPPVVLAPHAAPHRLGPAPPLPLRTPWSQRGGSSRPTRMRHWTTRRMPRAP